MFDTSSTLQARELSGVYRVLCTIAPLLRGGGHQPTATVTSVASSEVHHGWRRHPLRYGSSPVTVASHGGASSSRAVHWTSSGFLGHWDLNVRISSRTCSNTPSTATGFARSSLLTSRVSGAHTLSIASHRQRIVRNCKWASLTRGAPAVVTSTPRRSRQTLSPSAGGGATTWSSPPRTRSARRSLTYEQRVPGEGTST
jgi:hypothetical protein